MLKIKFIIKYKFIINLLILSGLSTSATYSMTDELKLLDAIYNQDEELVLSLLNKVENLDYESENGFTPIEAAILADNPKFIRLLIKHGASANFQDKAGFTPLLFAIGQKKYDLIQLLADNGADLDFIDNDGYTPLIFAAVNDDKKALTTLIRSGADMYSGYETNLMSTIVTQNKTILFEAILKESYDLNAEDSLGYSSIFYPVLLESEEWLKKIYHKGAEPNKENRAGYTPLLTAIMHSKNNIIAPLLRIGANPDYETSNDISAVKLAIAYNNMTALEVLLQHKAVTNVVYKDFSTPLIYAVYYNNPKAVELLIKYGADPNFSSVESETALSYAVNINNEEMAIKLLELGADINMLDKVGSTALNYAVLSDNASMVQLLINNGALIDNSFSANTALRTAVVNGNEEMVKLLLAQGADPNIAGANGIKPLMSDRDDSNMAAYDAVAEAVFEKYWIRDKYALTKLINYNENMPAEIFLESLVSVFSTLNKDTVFRYFNNFSGFTPPTELLKIRQGDCDEFSSLAANILNIVKGIPAEDMRLIVIHGIEDSSGIEVKPFDHSGLLVKFEGEMYCLDPTNDLSEKLETSEEDELVKKISAIFKKMIKESSGGTRELIIHELKLSELKQFLVYQITHSE